MIDPFNEDVYNKEFPSQQTSFSIDSEGSQIFVMMEQADGKHLHPTIIFFHGIPGAEKNHDLAHVLKRAGFNCVIFHYRGSWGSHGYYSIRNCIIDGVNVIKHIREHSDDFLVDPFQIFLLGFSMGGMYSFLASKETNIKNLIIISGFDPNPVLTDPNEEIRAKEQFDNLKFPLIFQENYEIISDIKNNPQYNIYDQIKSFRNYKILFLASSKDDILPAELYFSPFLKELELNRSIDVESELFLTDHSFSDKRIALGKRILEWLKFN